MKKGSLFFILFLLPLMTELYAHNTASSYETERGCSCDIPRKGPRGPRGPRGPAGPPGPSEIAHFHSFNSFASGGTTISENGFIPFTEASKGAGSSINFDGTNTFSFTETGNYYIQFVGYTASGHSGSIRVVVNGMPTDYPGTPISTDNTLLVLQEVVFVDEITDTLRLQVIGDDIDFLIGASAVITIEQLSEAI